ncbi:MAG: formylglycine-generating enzyme family protein [Paludibacteraceae bacterium]|nr:formylglycine-generating enzyme family protein [Paludibacteraceae bacterium]
MKGIKQILILLIGMGVAMLMLNSCDREGADDTTMLYGAGLYVVNGVTFRMVDIGGGKLCMGAQNNDIVQDNYSDKAYDNEAPVHIVRLNSFSIGESEVSQGLWVAVMGEDDPTVKQWDNEHGKGVNYPAYYVSYEEALSFIDKLNTIIGGQTEGGRFRLPTEAEWEYAARGGLKAKGYLYAGSNQINEVGWWSGNSDMRCHNMNGKNYNSLQLYDLSGNVQEWCSDWYGIYSAEEQVNPTGPVSGTHRVVRGGHYATDDYACRVSLRVWMLPNEENPYTGFRLVFQPKEEQD